MDQFFPTPDVLLELEPEEIGEDLLLYLKDQTTKEGGRNHFNRYNAVGDGNSAVQTYSAPVGSKAVAQVLAEAWAWLKNEGFLVPEAEGNSGEEWVCISRKGLKVSSKEDFKKLIHSRLLPKNSIDPGLYKKVWSIFIKGDFDTAVFAAFKEVEVRMRKASGLPENLIGVELARAAFHPETGPLSDKEHQDGGELQAYSALFAGAIGAFKNPGSHRDVDYDDPTVAAGLILFANTLLTIVDKRGIKKTEDDAIDAKIQASA